MFHLVATKDPSSPNISKIETNKRHIECKQASHRMQLSLDQCAYWDSVAETKTFTHAIDWNGLQSLVPNKKDAKILDFGCGYDRLTADIHNHGYENVVGIDSSLQMIQRATREFPNLKFARVNAPKKLPFEDNHFDLICLFAVLTAIPRTTDQKALVAELKRVLKHDSGLIYISYCLLNQDERNVARYNHQEHSNDNDNNDRPYGVFELAGEGALLRHHDINYIQKELLEGWNTKHVNVFTVTTMNGNQSNAFQIVAQKAT